MQVRRGVLELRAASVPPQGAVVRVLPVRRVEPRALPAGQPHARTGPGDEGVPLSTFLQRLAASLQFHLRRVILLLQETLCFSCTSKNRRNRCGRGLAAPDAHLGLVLSEAKPLLAGAVAAVLPLASALNSTTADPSFASAVAPMGVVQPHVVETDGACAAFSITTSESTATEVSSVEDVDTHVVDKAIEKAGQSELMKRKCDFLDEAPRSFDCKNMND